MFQMLDRPKTAVTFCVGLITVWIVDDVIGGYKP